jgi:prepilin-type N-terminal cleavage/methylation domain-containing protein
MTLRGRERGFSGIELVIVLALAAIVAAIALPRWLTFQRSFGLSNATRQVQSELHNLKSRAAAENSSFQFAYSQGASAYLIQRDGDVLATKPLDAGTSITKAGVITFSPRGTAAPNRVRLSDGQGACQQIVVSATGRVRSCTPNNCAVDC